jgi:hypothetical protein
MAKIRSAMLNFQPSTSLDIVGYRLYYNPAPELVTYDSPFVDLGINTSYDLSILPGALGTDQVYNLGVVSIDDVGNESEMSLAHDVKLDFAAPDAPGEMTITRI